jgi:hypothetical protein
MKRLIILGLALFLSGGLVQASDPIRTFYADSTFHMVDSLRTVFVGNKSYPEDLEHAFLLALMFYPEFVETRIDVKRRNIKTTMQCRPSIGSFFRSKDNRTYRIFVNKDSLGRDGVVFEELGFNAQVGILGHELAHVLDYESKSNAQIAVMGLQYLTDRKRREIEQDIDMLAIQRGLGHQINDFAVFVFEESKASESYKDYKKRFYFQPMQIRDILSTLPLYQFRTATVAE